MTREDVISVLGPVDDITVAEIVSSGATLADLREAWAWVHGDEAMMSEGRALPGTTVGKLIDLLEPDDDEPGAAFRPASTEW